ncbi:ThiF family adenylyltransferase [uncultured Dialister sp.]|uniref:ThiF family adenylyltransferase n=1 Tax=uncultured Dialister sp. TaxID=278064 RepID=UPI0025CE2D3E|nr:ThiF family adenylyltransferase [uncultured Dialister sp.]
MTEDLHKLLLEKLGDTGFTQVNLALPRREISAHFQLHQHEIELICKLGEAFPYTFPDIYIAQDSYKKLPQLPHVGSDCKLCLFDTSKSIPDIKNPIGLIVSTFYLARKAIEDGFEGINGNDVHDEISAYWNLKSDDQDFHIVESILSKHDEPTTLPGIWLKKIIYVADNCTLLQHYYDHIYGTNAAKDDYIQCLYLPFHQEISFPLPKTNLGFYSMIKKDSKAFPAYNKFLDNNLGKRHLVILDIGETEPILLPFMHRIIKTRIHGFRNARVPAYILLGYNNKICSPMRMSLTNMNQERLFNRGGVGLWKKLQRIAIIGCGSVGSSLVEAFKDCGTSHFSLIDADTLKADNLARHYCGYEYLRNHKVDAIKEKLIKENPNIDCRTFAIDGFEFLKLKSIELNEVDFVFVAVGDYPFEYKILKDFNAGIINKPIIIVWVEPFVAAAHAIIISKHQQVYDELFDSQLNFKYQVIKNAQQFLKRESGCQSTFMPYSIIELKKFIYDFLEYFTDTYVEKNKARNYVYTWFGKNLKDESLSFEINPFWKGKMDSGFYINRVD